MLQSLDICMLRLNLKWHLSVPGLIEKFFSLKFGFNLPNFRALGGCPLKNWTLVQKLVSCCRCLLHWRWNQTNMKNKIFAIKKLHYYHYLYSYNLFHWQHQKYLGSFLFAISQYIEENYFKKYFSQISWLLQIFLTVGEPF